jgi:hypothetical protein
MKILFPFYYIIIISITFNFLDLLIKQKYIILSIYIFMTLTARKAKFVFTQNRNIYKKLTDLTLLYLNFLYN